MSIEYRPPTVEDVPELGRICHDAFQDIAERHGFEKDFSSAEIARMLIGLLVASEDNFGVAAVRDGRPVGSNFLHTADDVASVGPITIDPPQQGGGIGRELMRAVLGYARDNGYESVRLQQDSYNMRSLALYASLGFDTKTPCAYLEVPPAELPDDSVRPLIADDLGAVDALSREIYKTSRRNEVAGHMAAGFFPAVVKERNGRVLGYLVLGAPGHGVMEDEEDAVVLAQQAARLARIPDVLRVFCPLIEGSLYRRFLAAGFRNKKVMNLMTLGPYAAPDGVWMPSVGY
jgi:GNAT superfamily N-acetyltransferase